LGGSIAEATLEQLNKKNSYGIITTHYTNVKLAAEKLEGIVNGAMLFDSKEMQPLYELQIGKPGSSFAFEIAKKIGFPSYVLKEAKKKSGGKHVRFDKQLQQLEIDKIKLQKQQQKASSYDENLNRMIEEYNVLITDLEKSKKKIINEAQEQALKIIESSNKAVENTIREIKEAAAENKKTKEIRRELEKKKDEITKENDVTLSTTKKPKLPKKKKPVVVPKGSKQEILKEGDWVNIVNSTMAGELISLSGKEAVININDVKITTTIEKIQKTHQPTKPNIRRKSYSDIVNDINQKAANFSLKLDLRGKRSEEALSDLKSYIDEAILLNQNEVSILHGKGYGILRELIREYLQTVDEIRDFGDAPLEMGGSGITRIYF
jgi:DNA mismatch repair protein MutS2